MPLELVLTVIPFIIISVLFYFTVVVQQKMTHRDPNPRSSSTSPPSSGTGSSATRRSRSPTAPSTTTAPTRPGRDGLQAGRRRPARGGKVGAVRGLNPRTAPTSTSTRSRRWAPVTRSRCWWFPPASGSSSRWPPPTSSTRSGCRSSCSSATSFPDPAANHSENKFQVSEIHRDRRVRRALREMCGTYHSMMNFEIRSSRPNDFKTYLQRASPERPTPRRCRPSTSHRSRPAPTRSTPGVANWCRRRASRGTAHAYRSQVVRDPDGVLRACDGRLRHA